MILGFKQTWPWGGPTFFREKILLGPMDADTRLNMGLLMPSYAHVHPKIHSIRQGHRWSAGKSIQMAYGVRTKNYVQFNKHISELGYCVSTQKINICYVDGYRGLLKERLCVITIDGKPITIPDGSLQTLAHNDGFESVDDFLKFFNRDFTGQIVHFTNLRY